MRLPNRLSMLISFTLALVALAVLMYAYVIVDIKHNDILSWSMLGLTGVCVGVMVVLAIATRDTVTRWLSAGLIGVVALEFAALAIASIGILIAPAALALIIISCFMLIRKMLSKANANRR